MNEPLFVIRRAKDSDISVLYERYCAFLTEDEEYQKKLRGFTFLRRIPFPTTVKEEFEWLIARTNVNVLVAMQGEKMVGFIVGEIYNWCGSAMLLIPFHGHLQMLYVCEEYRRVGIATKLYNELEKWFKNRGMGLCCVDVYWVNESAQGFYQSVGLMPDVLTMAKCLSDFEKHDFPEKKLGD